MFKKINDSKKGFTLIELLVVIAILGLLATIGLASFRSTQIKGRDSQRKNDLNQIQKALEMYYNDYGQYPDSLPAGGGNWQDAEGTLYMKEVPQDSRFGDYVYSSDNVSYQLYAQLENTQDICFTNGICRDYGIVCGTGNCNYAMSSQNVTP